MNFVSSSMSGRLRHVCVATATVALLGVAGLAALGVFVEEDEGQLWALRQQLEPPDNGFPTGVTFYNGFLFVADRENRQILVYDATGALMPASLTAAWRLGEADDSESPVFNWAPNQLTTATVQINGLDTPAILVSDGVATRALAFDTTGNYLFTISLDRAAAPGEPGVAINGLAMSPGAQFVFTSTSNPPTLSLQGSFAASWADDFGFGVDGAVLWFRDQPFDCNAQGQCQAAPVAELDGTEGNVADARVAREPYGVAFDAAGNLYTVDSVTERLNAYAPAANGGFTHLFTFGTPVTDGTTSEFYQSYGMTYWADGPGGARLFVADAINNRVLVYRPVLTPGAETLDYLFTVDGLGALDGFPFAVAIDPLSGRLAVTDDNGSPPRVWILQTANLAAFNLQVLDVNNQPVEVICSGNSDIAPQDYKVRFSVTVPARRPDVFNVEPQLNINGVEYTGQSFSSTPVLRELEVVSYEYSLTAPGGGFVGSLAFNAGATATSTIDVLFQNAVVRVSDCPAGNAAPTITAGPAPGFEGPQVSGWTPVFPDELYRIRLLAQDAGGISRIEYDLSGANQPPVIGPIAVEFEDAPTTAYVDVPLVEMGDTTIRFRAWDSNQLPSSWQTLDLRLVSVPDRWNDEGALVPPFSVGPPTPGLTYSQTGLPDGLTFNTATGVITGIVAFNTAGVHTVTVTESNGAAQSSVEFTWTIQNINVAPVANNDSYSTNEDTVLTVVAPGVLSNDTDEDSAPLTATLVSGASNGALVLAANGSFVYTPAANFYGTDSFTYRANDGFADSNVATVTITVDAVNDAPSFTAGANQVVTEDAGAQTVNNWATAISAGPNESSQTVTFVVVSNTNPALFWTQPAIASNGTLTYQSAANASGTATVTVRLGDSGGTANGGVDTSAPQTFTIAVTPVNDAPVAANDSYSTGEDTVLTVPAPGVLSNDTDTDGPVLTASLVTGPSHGTLVVLNPDGSFVYTPALDYHGPDSFVYKASDGTLSANATVAITVVPSNLPPVCTAVATPAIIWPPNHQPVYLSVSGITDPEGGALRVTYTILQDEPTDGPGQGNTMQDGGIGADGRVWVRAERSGTGDGRVYLVGYTATDAFLASCTGVFTVSVPHDQSGAPAVLSPGRWNSITGQQVAGFLPPDAVNDAVTVKKGEAATIAVLSNDIANGQTLTVAIVTPPSIGVATLNANGTIKYQPPAGITGTTSFTYKVTAPGGATDTATVTVTIKK